MNTCNYTEYKNYCKQINGVKTKISNYNAKIDTLTTDLMRLCDTELFVKLYKQKQNGDAGAFDENRAKTKSVQTEINAVSDKVKRETLKLSVMNANADYMLFLAVTPCLLDILHGFNNKRLGDATKETMQNCYMQKFSGRFYFNTNNSLTVIDYADAVNYTGKREIQVFCKDGFILNGNRVNGALTINDVQLCDNENAFINDVSGRVKAIEKRRNEIEIAKAKLNLLINDYNNLTVKGIKHYSHI